MVMKQPVTAMKRPVDIAPRGMNPGFTGESQF